MKFHKRPRLIILIQLPIIFGMIFGIFYIYPKHVRLGELRSDYQQRFTLASDWDELEEWYAIRRMCLLNGEYCEILEYAEQRIAEFDGLPTRYSHPEFVQAINERKCLPRQYGTGYTVPEIREMKSICYENVKAANGALQHPINMIGLTMVSLWLMVYLNYVLWGKSYYGSKREGDPSNP